MRRLPCLPPRRTALSAVALILAISCAFSLEAADPKPAETVLLSGKILTVDKNFTIAEAIAVADGRILAVGSDEEIRRHVTPDTKVVNLNGKTVVPGLIETHCHSIGVANGMLSQTWVELKSIPAVQRWIRDQAKDLPAGRWIRVPRTDITRLKEFRFPTRAELDAASTTHPVVFTAARKSVLNSLGFQQLGVTAQTKTLAGGTVILDESGQPKLISGGDSAIRKHFPTADFTEEQKTAALRHVHQVYNSLGITGIFERAANKGQYELYRQLRADDQLTVRTTLTIRQQFRTGDEVAPFTEKLALMTGDGDEWVKVGPLKLTVDGGIHWGTTHLREPYGPTRIKFYALEGIQEPEWTGSIRYTVDQMTSIFKAGHALGWQMCVHVTGDAGVDKVLDALDATNESIPLKDRRFTFTHAYFPIDDSIRRAATLGVCLDTQSYTYHKDAAAIAKFYGTSWAERLIGVGDWVNGGVVTAINSDHMIGTDPDHALQSFNPFLALYIAVTRKNDAGRVYGVRQKLDRRTALRCVTSNAAYLSFDENKTGSLEKGKLADLAVLDRDYLGCAEEEIRRIKVLRTMVGGRFMLERKK